MEMKVQRQKSGHHTLSPIPSEPAVPRDRLSLLQAQMLAPSPLPSCGSPFPGQDSDTFQKLHVWKRKPGCGGGLCEYWERVWDQVRGLEAPLTSAPRLPLARPGASARKTPFCSCANCSRGTAMCPLLPPALPNPQFPWPYSGGNKKPISQLALFQSDKIKIKPEV